MLLATLSRVLNPAEAQLVRARLEVAGFHPVVTNELSALSLDGYALAAGGILVQVPEDEATEAAKFLSESTQCDEPS